MTLRTIPITDAITFAHSGDGSSLVTYQPGNGTRYVVFLQSTSWMSAAALAECGWTEGTVLVQVLNHRSTRAYPCAPRGFIAAHYLEEKMGVSRHDALVIAELLAHLLPNREAESAAENVD